MELGYARVSTSRQDLDRQLDALTVAGLDPTRIYVDNKSGASADRPGLAALLEYAREGDVVVFHTLDRLGRTVRDTLNLIGELDRRGIGIRTLADPIRIDSTDPDDPMGRLAVAALALFGRMERTYAGERAAHARTVATATGRRTGRPSVVTDAQLAHATELRDGGATVAQIVAVTGLTRSTLYRHLPPRPPEQVTAAGAEPEDAEPAPTAPDRAPPGDPLRCPTCGHRPTGRADLVPHRADLATVWLYLDEHGRVGERRHCARCQPHGRVVIVACSRCGDGPLAVGPPDADAAAAVPAWLAHRGWTITPELVCTRHTRQRMDHAAAGPGDSLATTPPTPLHDRRPRSRRSAEVGPASYPEHR